MLRSVFFATFNKLNLSPCVHRFFCIVFSADADFAYPRGIDGWNEFDHVGRAG